MEQTMTAHTSSPNFYVHTVGIHSIRYNTFEVINPNMIVFALGIYLVKFDITSQTIKNKIKLTDAAIRCIKIVDEYLVAATHRGHVYIVDIDSFSIVATFMVANADIVCHLSVSTNMKYICVSSNVFFDNTDNKTYPGAIWVFEKEIIDSEKKFQFNQVFHTKIVEGFCEFAKNSCDKEVLLIFEKEYLDQTLNIEVCPASNKSTACFYKVKCFDPCNNFQIMYDMNLENNCEVLTLQPCGNYIALCYEKRSILIFDSIESKVVLSIYFEGKGALGAFEFFDKKIYLTNSSGCIVEIDVLKHIAESRTELTIPKNIGIQSTDFTVLISRCDDIVAINWMIRMDAVSQSIYFANETGLHCYSLKEKKMKFSLPSILSTCGCGITMNRDTNYIAVGDLGNNITIFNSNWGNPDNVTCLANDFVAHKIQIEEMIRTVHWEEKLDIIFVGTMDGKIYQYSPNGDVPIVELANLGHTVTCVRVYYSKYFDFPILAAATISGKIVLYKISQNEVTVLNDFTAHSPQEDNQDLRFGSLKLKSEIWSLTCYPESSVNTENKLHFITSSEDQTIKIWEYSCGTDTIQLSPKLVTSYKNHQMAVTSVDWKGMKVLHGEVLASCSDDCTIQIYDPVNNFEHVKTLRTFDIVCDWHTITYLSLEENGTHLAVTTQNGYVVIFSLETWASVYCEKLHQGGIEGLCWKGNLLVACASDLNISIIKTIS